MGHLTQIHMTGFLLFLEIYRKHKNGGFGGVMLIGIIKKFLKLIELDFRLSMKMKCGPQKFLIQMGAVQWLSAPPVTMLQTYLLFWT